MNTILTQIAIFCASFPNNAVPFGRDLHKACMIRVDDCVLEQPVGRDPQFWFEYCQRIEFDRAIGR